MERVEAMVDPRHCVELIALEVEAAILLNSLTLVPLKPDSLVPTYV